MDVKHHVYLLTYYSESHANVRSESAREQRIAYIKAMNNNNDNDIKLHIIVINIDTPVGAQLQQLLSTHVVDRRC